MKTISKARKLPIGGFLKQCLSDYPGHISAMVFTRGCNFRCTYCHNPMLVYPEKIRKSPAMDTLEILQWIENNKLLLDAVVISGGEPTLHHSLPEFTCYIKRLGLKVKLDTNGTNPAMLRQLISEGQVDYVAMDIKAPLELSNYQKIVGLDFSATSMARVIESVRILKSGTVEHEFRTTLDSSITETDIEKMIDSISGKYYLQLVRDNSLNLIQSPHTAESLKKFAAHSYPNTSIAIREGGY